GGGGIGVPAGPAAARGNAAGAGQGRGGGGAGADQGRGTVEGAEAAAKVPGLVSAPFKGGYSFALWGADVATGEGREIWRPDPADPRFTAINNFRWAGN